MRKEAPACDGGAAKTAARSFIGLYDLTSLGGRSGSFHQGCFSFSFSYSTLFPPLSLTEAESSISWSGRNHLIMAAFPRLLPLHALDQSLFCQRWGLDLSFLSPFGYTFPALPLFYCSFLLPRLVTFLSFTLASNSLTFTNKHSISASSSRVIIFTAAPGPKNFYDAQTPNLKSGITDFLP